VARFGLQQRQHGLVATVDAVEIANGEGAGGSHARVPEAAENLHEWISF
jgi:hypothetical protein